MKCKSSKPVLTRLGRLAAGALLLLASAARAQQASPSASPRPAMTYVRFWNMLAGKDATPLQLLTAEDKVLSTAPPSNYGFGYMPLNPGSYNFTVRRGGDAANALKKQALVLRGDVYVTYLVSEKNGQPNVELIDDTQDPKKINDPSQLVIRQFMPGARVTVTTKDGAASQEIGYGESTRLDNLPNRSTLLTMKATGLGSEAKVWNLEVDLSTYHHATLLVVGDPYGRFRPRIAYDGQSVAALAAQASPKP